MRACCECVAHARATIDAPLLGWLPARSRGWFRTQYETDKGSSADPYKTLKIVTLNFIKKSSGTEFVIRIDNTLHNLKNDLTSTVFMKINSWSLFRSTDSLIQTTPLLL